MHSENDVHSQHKEELQTRAVLFNDTVQIGSEKAENVFENVHPISILERSFAAIKVYEMVLLEVRSVRRI